MRNRLEHLEPAFRQLRIEELGESRSEQRILVHDYHSFGRLAGLIVDRHKVIERRLGDDTESGPEPERVLEAAGDDVVGHADIDNVGKIIARGCLASGEAD
jgi:hypothetical protein